MAMKKCEQCEQKKGPRAFEKGEQICRECKGGKKAAVSRKMRGNGHAGGRFAGALEQLKSARADDVGDLAKIDALIEQMEALG